MCIIAVSAQQVVRFFYPIHKLKACLSADYVKGQCSLLSVESALAIPAPTESPMLPLTW